MAYYRLGWLGVVVLGVVKATRDTQKHRRAHRRMRNLVAKHSTAQGGVHTSEKSYHRRKRREKTVESDPENW